VSVALVTGGGRGIGRTIASTLTAAGWSVAITGRTAASLDETVDAGDAALALPGDASSAADVQEAVRRSEAELGPIDLLVANAGRFSAAGPVWETDPDLWWEDVTVNLRGPQLALWAALPGMVARGSGRVVVLGSGIGVQGMPYSSAYSTSKAAVMRLVESVAGELGGTEVALFVISPGLVKTDMTEFPETYLAHDPEWRGLADVEGIPPSRAAELILELASGRHDAASGRYLRLVTDLSQAGAAASADEDAGTLRLVPLPE
jgi:NAD(P)-dependent dehydrogenase (short-subunit alcohol dehydrogenase family)